MSGPSSAGYGVLCCLRNVIAVVLVCGGIALAGKPERQAGWPQWRGPTFDGISTETGLADAWPAAGPPVLWTRELGQGYSSFIAVGPHVFTLTQTLYEQAVVCLDADTGKTVWSSRFGWPYDGGGLYPGPRSTPTWHAGRIYFSAPDGTIGCLNAADGASVWSTNPTKEFHGQGTDFGYSCSPIVVDGKVIVPVGGAGASLVALSAKDGSLIWKGGDSPASYASPLPITLKGEAQIIALLENSLAAFDLKTGRLLWEDEFSEGYDEHSAAPLYREPFLMTSGPFRSGAKCVRLDDLTNGGKPLRVWESLKFSNDVASSVLYQDHIYGFDLRDAQSRVSRPSRGEYRCLEFETGKIRWSTDKVGHANTIVVDGKLLLFNDRGEVILARLGTEEYEELARVQVFNDEICWSSPALHRGRLYLRTQTRAVCLYLRATPLEVKQEVKSVAEIPRTRAFDPMPLLGGEREFPATTPEWSEFGLWYLWSLAGILLATMLSLLTHCAIWMLGKRRLLSATDARHEALRWGLTRCVFWAMVILVGVVGSPLINRRQSDYVFLWPIVLWAALQLTVLSIIWAEHQANRRRARWVSRMTGILFFGVSALYFHLCRKSGLSIEWGFLSALLPAFPVMALIGLELQRRSRFRLWIDPFCMVASFSAYFASAALFIKWWLRVGS